MDSIIELVGVKKHPDRPVPKKEKKELNFRN